MALISLGRNTALAYQLATPLTDVAPAPAGAPADVVMAKNEAVAVRDEAAQAMTKAGGEIQKSLASWIPGDFLVVYATLLASWGALQNNFAAMLLLAGGLSAAFVIAGAFAIDGFRGLNGELAGKLFARVVVGFGVSVVASVTVPTSGWHELTWFSTNEQSVLTTVGLSTVLLVLILTGLQKLGLITPNPA